VATSTKNIKLDKINKRILGIIHRQADISNQNLADIIGLSPSACFQRTKSLHEAGYFNGFHTDLDLDRIVENVLAYVEFKLKSNSPQHRKAFEAEIEKIPEFMDCLRISGEFDYISFTCCSNIQSLNVLVDDLSGKEELGVNTVKVRLILERAKWYLGYPLNKLNWFEN
jgi:Lrp/AsnC family leucine-responsive transcriptional regulator